MPHIAEGRYTIDLLTKLTGLSRQSVLNHVVKLRKEGLAHTSGGRHQKRIYTITSRPLPPHNGLFTLINKHSEEKLVERFRHHVHGEYTAEHAIIDSLAYDDARMRDAASHLFLLVADWTKLFRMARERGLEKKLKDRYAYARTITRVRRMPGRYQR